MKASKVILIIAGALVVCGGAVVGIAAVNGGLLPEQTQMQSQTITEDISKINVSASWDDIRVVSADTDQITVKYSTAKMRQYNITADGEILSMEYIPTENFDIEWYDYIGFSDRGDVLIEVPQNRQYDISLHTTSGDIEIYDAKGAVYADTTSGDIEIADCVFTAAECSSQHGDIALSDVVADSITLAVDKGDIKLRNTDGNLTAACDYGDIDIENISGDSLTLSNDYGDIEGTIRGAAEDYTILSQTRKGSNNLRDRSGGDKTLTVETNSGDVKISFLS
ncbi:MAG: DUF4097 domain-containing protein [Oscillospiraceae bacterium]|nr:DUF4097 domain-containing protein [Oscillospiraceae bacterium]